MKETNELVEYVVSKSIKKANRDLISLAVLSVLAGMAIALGAVANIITSADFYILQNSGFGKFIGASVFPVGLIIIVLLGYDLFTSNCMLISAVYEKKISLAKFLKNLVLVLFFNFIGCLIVAYITVRTHNFSENAQALLFSMANHKVHSNFFDIILKGILCNLLVCSATLLGYGAKDSISKIFGIWFPIMLFIILGYDHIVANMLYLPAAYMLHADISILQIIYNFVFATIGNFIGGAFLAFSPLYLIYKKEQKINAKN